MLVTCALAATPARAATNGAIAVTTPDAPTKLATLDAGSRLPKLLPGLPIDSMDGAWASDGKSLAFSSRLRGKADIYAIGATGGLRLVTVDDDENFEPTWSPDGRRIAFAGCPATGKRPAAGPACAGNADIYVMDLATRTRQRVTTHTGDDRRPAWSPDGTQIAYESQRAGHSDIWVVAPDGSANRQLTSAPAYAATDETHPAWSPDSARLAFSSGVAGQYAVDSIARSGLDAKRLTKPYAASPFPTWSPDGAQIAFSVGRDLLVMPSAGVLPMDATLLASNATRPAWAPVPASETPNTIVGVPVMNARTIALRKTIDATAGVLLRFRPAGAPASAQDATALVQDGTFAIVRRSPTAPTLRIMGAGCGGGDAQAARARRRPRYPRTPTVKGNGVFRALSGKISALPEGTRYVLRVKCLVRSVASRMVSVQRFTVNVSTGLVRVQMRTGTRDTTVARPGRPAAVNVVYLPDDLSPRTSKRVVSMLFGNGKGRFRTRGRTSTATVRG